MPSNNQASGGVLKRPNRRQVAAEATRQEVLGAARRLFARRGYAATSVADIASEAGVAVATLYASVGQKHAIVMALADLIAEGSDVSPLAGELQGETTPTRLLSLAVQLTRQLQERCGDILDLLRATAAVEQEVAEVVARGAEMHRARALHVARKLDQLQALRQGMTVQEAADVISLLTDIDCYARLTRDYGWTLEQAEQWIRSTLSLLLLRDG